MDRSPQGLGGARAFSGANASAPRFSRSYRVPGSSRCGGWRKQKTRSGCTVRVPGFKLSSASNSSTHEQHQPAHGGTSPYTCRRGRRRSWMKSATCGVLSMSHGMLSRDGAADFQRRGGNKPAAAGSPLISAARYKYPAAPMSMPVRGRLPCRPPAVMRSLNRPGSPWSGWRWCRSCRWPCRRPGRPPCPPPPRASCHVGCGSWLRGKPGTVPRSFPPAWP